MTDETQERVEDAKQFRSDRDAVHGSVVSALSEVLAHGEDQDLPALADACTDEILDRLRARQREEGDGPSCDLCGGSPDDYAPEDGVDGWCSCGKTWIAPTDLYVKSKRAGEALLGSDPPERGDRVKKYDRPGLLEGKATPRDATPQREEGDQCWICDDCGREMWSGAISDEGRCPHCGGEVALWERATPQREDEVPEEAIPSDAIRTPLRDAPQQEGEREPTCPKCGSDDINVRWYDECEAVYRRHHECDNTDEHLCRTCRDCGYEWDDPVLDTEPPAEREGEHTTAESIGSMLADTYNEGRRLQDTVITSRVLARIRAVARSREGRDEPPAGREPTAKEVWIDGFTLGQSYEDDVDPRIAYEDEMAERRANPAHQEDADDDAP